MSFWLDAVLTRQYLVNRLPTSTLPENITPFEVITNGKKPDLSHLRVWGCECFVAIPSELRGKAGPKRFKAIFVGYEEHRVGWRVHSVEGKYSFSNDVIFNENLSGRLGVPHSLPLASPSPSVPSRPLRDHLRTRTIAGQAFDEVLHLKALQKLEREKRTVVPFAPVVTEDVNGGAVDDMRVPSNGSDIVLSRLSSVQAAIVYLRTGLSDLSPLPASIAYLSSFVTSMAIDDPSDFLSLSLWNPSLFRSI